jgi:uncharacterized protein
VRALDAVTIVRVDPADRDAEKKFRQQGVETSVIRTDGRTGRRAIQWFSYELPNAGEPVALVATYNTDQRRPRSFQLVINGVPIASETQQQGSISRFHDKEYALPAEILAGRSTITVRFEATQGLEVTPVFGIRLIRK